MNIVDKIIEERQRLGLAQIPFSEALGVSRAMIARFEKKNENNKVIHFATEKLFNDYFNSLKIVEYDTIEEIKKYGVRKNLDQKGLAATLCIPISILQLIFDEQPIPDFYYQKIVEQFPETQENQEPSTHTNPTTPGLNENNENDFINFLKEQVKDLKEQLKQEQEKREKLQKELSQAKEFIAQQQGLADFEKFRSKTA